MATLDQVRGLLDAGHSYESIGAELGITPGLAYMIATGVPADGSGPPVTEPDRPALQPGAQRLAQPVARGPIRTPVVTEWIKHRAETELRRGHA
jgi:hypothetical protein